MTNAGVCSLRRFIIIAITATGRDDCEFTGITSYWKKTFGFTNRNLQSWWDFLSCVAQMFVVTDDHLRTTRVQVDVHDDVTNWLLFTENQATNNINREGYNNRTPWRTTTKPGETDALNLESEEGCPERTEIFFSAEAAWVDWLQKEARASSVRRALKDSVKLTMQWKLSAYFSRMTNWRKGACRWERHRNFLRCTLNKILFNFPLG